MARRPRGVGVFLRARYPCMARRTLQQPYASGPMVILWGWVFLMSEVPLYGSLAPPRRAARRTVYRGTSLIRNTHPHRITIGP